MGLVHVRSCKHPNLEERTSQGNSSVPTPFVQFLIRKSEIDYFTSSRKTSFCQRRGLDTIMWSTITRKTPFCLLWLFHFYFFTAQQCKLHQQPQTFVIWERAQHSPNHQNIYSKQKRDFQIHARIHSINSPKMKWNHLIDRHWYLLHTPKFVEDKVSPFHKVLHAATLKQQNSQCNEQLNCVDLATWFITIK